MIIDRAKSIEEFAREWDGWEFQLWRHLEELMRSPDIRDWMLARWVLGELIGYGEWICQLLERHGSETENDLVRTQETVEDLRGLLAELGGGQNGQK